MKHWISTPISNGNGGAPRVWSLYGLNSVSSTFQHDSETAPGKLICHRRFAPSCLHTFCRSKERIELGALVHGMNGFILQRELKEKHSVVELLWVRKRCGWSLPSQAAPDIKSRPKSNLLALIPGIWGQRTWKTCLQHTAKSLSFYFIFVLCHV